MKCIVLSFVWLTLLAGGSLRAAEDSAHHHGHSEPMAELAQGGNGAFAAIQEVVARLLADPDTDWSRVDLEALRSHLVDMHNFTLNVELVSQMPVEGGVEFTVRPTTPGAAGSLGRLFEAHPGILEQESGWDMTTRQNEDGSYTARVVGPTSDDATRIRGLGYIGVVAYGQHHPAHHWRMATGSDPHHGH